MSDIGAESGKEAKLKGEKALFGGLTAEEVAAGLHAEAAHLAVESFMRNHESAEPGSPEAQEALNGVLRAQAEGDILAATRLTIARLEVAGSIARDLQTGTSES